MRDIALDWIRRQFLQRQYDEAMYVSGRRLEEADKYHRVGKNDQPRSQLVRDSKIGCMGERMYLVVYDQPFSLMNFYPKDLRAKTNGVKPSDFGNHDIKTKEKHGSHLLLQKDDPPDRVYILASAYVGDLNVDLCGWALGKWVMLRHYWGRLPGKDREQYNFPQELLQPMRTLPPRDEADEKNRVRIVSNLRFDFDDASAR